MKKIILAAVSALAIAAFASPASAFEWNQSGVGSQSVAGATGGTLAAGGSIGNGFAATQSANVQGAQSTGFAGVIANNGSTLTESGQTSVVEGASAQTGLSLGNAAQIGAAGGIGDAFGGSAGEGFSLQILP